jgi:hypothetical protein
MNIEIGDSFYKYWYISDPGVLELAHYICNEVEEDFVWLEQYRVGYEKETYVNRARVLRSVLETFATSEIDAFHQYREYEAARVTYLENQLANAKRHLESMEAKRTIANMNYCETKDFTASLQKECNNDFNE